MAKSEITTGTLTGAPVTGKGYGFIQPCDGSTTIYVPKDLVKANGLTAADIGREFQVTFYERADKSRCATELLRSAGDPNLDQYDLDMKARMIRVELLLTRVLEVQRTVLYKVMNPPREGQS